MINNGIMNQNQNQCSECTQDKKRICIDRQKCGDYRKAGALQPQIAVGEPWEPQICVFCKNFYKNMLNVGEEPYITPGCTGRFNNMRRKAAVVK